MRSNRYKVVFRGKTTRGREMAAVKEGLACRLGIGDQATDRLFSGRPVVMKKNLDYGKALQYRRAFEKLGAICEIAVEGGSEAKRQPPGIETAQTTEATERRVLACPNCKHEQDVSPECERCGIIFSKYEAISDRGLIDLPDFGESRPDPPPLGRRLSAFTVAALIAAFSLLFMGVHQWWVGLEKHHGPGIMAPHLPEQEEVQGGTPFIHNGYTIIPLASFWVEARVLSTKRYRLGRESELAPVDFALGWGPMSDEAVLKDLTIRQSNRFYFWSAKHAPIPRQAIEENSANMHLIPGGKTIARDLKRARKGDIVTIRGYLVKVNAEDGWHWRSSLTRRDTGNGACELVWVEALDIL